MSVQQKAVAGKSRRSQLKQANYHLRFGGAEDLHAVYRLNRQVFDSPWSVAALLSALESGYELILCEIEGEVVGYLLSLQILDEIQLMQIAVSESYRRQGLAAAMSAYLLGHANGVVLVSLELRSSNRAAHALYLGLGFEEVGLRKKYYAADASGFREDALLMNRNL